MVNGAVTSAREAERGLAIGYAPAAVRPALAALFALDGRLGALVAGTREPMVAQMRLTWWHEALVALDHASPPAEPLLAALARDVLPAGVAGAELATMIDGWERLLEQTLDGDALAGFAAERGGRLFALSARLLGDADERAGQAGEGWALADLAGRTTNQAARAAAAALALPRLDDALAKRWDRRLRPLGAMALLARADLAGVAAGSPRRVARLLYHRLTGS